MKNLRGLSLGVWILGSGLMWLFMAGCDAKDSDWDTAAEVEKNLWYEISDIPLIEGQPGATLSLALSSAPSGMVEVVLESPDGQVEVMPGDTLRFMPAQWSDTLQVEIIAREDHAVETAVHSGSLNIDARSDDPDFNIPATEANALIFNIQDQDVAGLELPPSTLVISERQSGGEHFALSLLSQPTDDVEILVSLAATDTHITFLPEEPRLVFTPENWNLSQDFMVFAALDDVHGNHRANSLLFSLFSDDANYAALELDPVIFQILDTSEMPHISFDQNSFETIIEGQTPTLDFIVILEGSSVQEVRFAIRVVENPNSPQPGQDFVALADTLVLAAHQTETTVSLEILNDEVAEASETGIFYLEAFENCQVQGNTVQVIVVFEDDD